MKELKFPLLTKDDIDVRIGQLNKDQTKASLLLYQDARCGMKYLDQVVGCENWQKKYYEVRGLVLCSLGINVNYDQPEKEPRFIFKDDTGTAGSIEEEKSIISDSFKRCCVCWGLARELYTAPTIWVKIESKYDKFKVASIDYNEQREIKSIEIANDKGEIVFSYGKYEKGKKESTNPVAKADTVDENAPIRKEELEWLFNWIKEATEERYANFQGWLKKSFGTDDVAELTASQGIIICARLGKK